MVDTGWIAKSTYFEIPHWGFGRSRDSHDPYLSCCKVLFARLSRSQPSMGSLTGFSIPCHLVCCYWHRSRPCLDRCQCIGLLRPFQMIHVCNGLVIGAPPCGTFCRAGDDCDEDLSLELDSDNVDFVDSSHDIQGQHRTACCRSPRTNE